MKVVTKNYTEQMEKLNIGIVKTDISNMEKRGRGDSLGWFIFMKDIIQLKTYICGTLQQWLQWSNERHVT